MKLFAKCKDKSCVADFYAFAQKQPIEGESLQLKMFTLDTRNTTHSGSCMRQLNGDKKEQIGEADKKMEFGDKMPPNIYKTEVLQKAK